MTTHNEGAMSDPYGAYLLGRDDATRAVLELAKSWREDKHTGITFEGAAAQIEKALQPQDRDAVNRRLLFSEDHAE